MKKAQRQKYIWWAMAVSIVAATVITNLNRNSKMPKTPNITFEILQDSLTAKPPQGWGKFTITSWMALKKQRQLLQAMQHKDSLEISDIHTLKEIDRQLNQMLYEH
jgi:hypothetical protein